jgi:hypothetical protein
MGEVLYPHDQWQRLARLWESFYPLDKLDAERRALLDELSESIPSFVRILADHRPPILKGASLAEALEVSERTPAHLHEHFTIWERSPSLMYRAAPSLAFAALGQARADGRLTPESESLLLAKLLTHWALKSSLNPSTACAASPAHAIQPRFRNEGHVRVQKEITWQA